MPAAIDRFVHMAHATRMHEFNNLKAIVQQGARLESIFRLWVDMRRAEDIVVDRPPEGLGKL